VSDASYVGYTSRHLYQRIEEHKGSTINNHLREQHSMAPVDITHCFNISRKCQNKLVCLIFEMLSRKELKPTLNKQYDSIRAKLFLWIRFFWFVLFFFLVNIIIVLLFIVAKSSQLCIKKNILLLFLDICCHTVNYSSLILTHCWPFETFLSASCYF